jgi:hypothetical protein
LGAERNAQGCTAEDDERRCEPEAAHGIFLWLLGRMAEIVA